MTFVTIQNLFFTLCQRSSDSDDYDYVNGSYVHKEKNTFPTLELPYDDNEDDVLDSVNHPKFVDIDEIQDHTDLTEITLDENASTGEAIEEFFFAMALEEKSYKEMDIGLPLDSLVTYKHPVDNKSREECNATPTKI